MKNKDGGFSCLLDTKGYYLYISYSLQQQGFLFNCFKQVKAKSISRDLRPIFGESLGFGPIWERHMGFLMCY